MAEKRKQERRADSDRVIKKIVDTLRIIERMSEGEEDVDFTEQYADLVGLMRKLGRRKEDDELGEALDYTFKSIANSLNKLLQTRKEKRKVRVIKVTTEEAQRAKSKAFTVGW
jgi:hypothetical protein